jgi:hypothetical protein
MIESGPPLILLKKAKARKNLALAYKKLCAAYRTGSHRTTDSALAKIEDAEIKLKKLGEVIS